MFKVKTLLNKVTRLSFKVSAVKVNESRYKLCEVTQIPFQQAKFQKILRRDKY